jgi:hypothetical protein
MKVTYIIPVHKYNEGIGKLLKAAIGSIGGLEENNGNKVVIVGPKSVLEKVKPCYTLKLPVEFLENAGEKDFFSQVNFAAMNCTTEWFSVLELDDTYEPYWLKVAERNADKGSVLVPLAQLVSKGRKVGLVNEIAWNASFVENESKLGYIDSSALESFMDFNVTGSFIRTEDFISVGGLKPSLKIAAWYEFLLRMAYNSKNVYVVPKIGYVHTIGRDGSYMEESHKNITPEEGKWLIDTARQEYFFKEDRRKVFDPKQSD